MVDRVAELSQQAAGFSTLLQRLAEISSWYIKVFDSTPTLSPVRMPYLPATLPGVWLESKVFCHVDAGTNPGVVSVTAGFVSRMTVVLWYQECYLKSLCGWKCQSWRFALKNAPFTPSLLINISLFLKVLFFQIQKTLLLFLIKPKHGLLLSTSSGILRFLCSFFPSKERSRIPHFIWLRLCSLELILFIVLLQLSVS